MIALEPIDAVVPAAYNPRKVDEYRIGLLELSLRKLGWLLPAYAAVGGELISGHQRIVASRRLGYTQIPVVRVDVPCEHERRGLNILFNRATNDFGNNETGATGAERLRALDVEVMAKDLPDVPVDDFPCLNAVTVPTKDLWAANYGPGGYARNVAKSLFARSIVQPIIVDEQWGIINGKGRLRVLCERGVPEVEYVQLKNKAAAFARAMLNLLSMDFDIERHYGDVLRYGSFRRAVRSRRELGRGILFAVEAGLGFRGFKAGNRKHWYEFARIHGSKLLDFGAGHLHDAEILRSHGFDVSTFEPYRLGDAKQIDKVKSLANVRGFLADVAAGKRWDSIFVSSVFNSIPFDADRRHVVKIISALCSEATRVYAHASSLQQDGYETLHRKYQNGRSRQYLGFPLDYEHGIVLGDMRPFPKVQKYFTVAEFYDVWKSAFGIVRAGTAHHNVQAVAMHAKPLDGLRRSIEFEFDLPYPDGSRMGLVPEALEAFGKRLGGVRA